MKRISISELQNNPSKILLDLPVEIIRYGRTVGYIISPEGGVVTNLDDISEDSLVEAVNNAAGTQEATIGTLPKVEAGFGQLEYGQLTEDFVLPEFTPGYCSVCRAKKLVKGVKYEDSDGEVFDTTLCEKDVKKLEGHFKEVGGHYV